jgi:hypothetical protein
MGREDWYRATSWGHEQEKAFFDRLHRSRGAFHKAQYLRIQALYLQSTGSPELIEKALELLAILVRECPDESQLSLAHLQTARGRLALGRVEEAVASFKFSLDAQRRFRGIRAGAHLEFGWTIVQRRLTHLYADALSALDEFGGDERLPVEQYQAFAIRAIILEALGNAAEAARFAQASLDAAGLRHSGFARHPDLGLVNQSDERVNTQLRRLCEPSLWRRMIGRFRLRPRGDARS